MVVYYFYIFTLSLRFSCPDPCPIPHWKNHYWCRNQCLLTVRPPLPTYRDWSRCRTPQNLRISRILSPHESPLFQDLVRFLFCFHSFFTCLFIFYSVFKFQTAKLLIFNHNFAIFNSHFLIFFKFSTTACGTRSMRSSKG